jgi:biotin carboxylase
MLPLVVKPVDNIGSRGCPAVDRATDAPPRSRTPSAIPVGQAS